VPRGAEAPAEVVTVDDREDIEKDEERDEEDEVKGEMPLYKKLYEASSRQRDARLRELDFEVRLAEKGRLWLELLQEVIPKITPAKKVQILLIFLYLFIINASYNELMIQCEELNIKNGVVAVNPFPTCVHWIKGPTLGRIV
jgi:hypothetical protein